MAPDSNPRRDEWEDDDDDDDDDDGDGSPNLYSLLNLRRGATEEEITRSYRSLSTTFHPDKVRRQQRISTAAGDEDTAPGGDETEDVQRTFLQFKKAHEILIDPVLRLAYDSYGEFGVELVRRVQQQQRERAMRRDRKRRRRRRREERGEDGDGDDDEEADDEEEDGYDEEEEDDDDDDDDEEGGGGGGRDFRLYERLEELLVAGPRRDYARARDELDRFMEQHDYQRNLTEDNLVHLNLSMTLPPAVDLKGLLYDGRSYLRHVQKSLLPSPPPADDGERRYLQQRVMQERRIVDYQIRQLKAGQKADLGFTLSSVQPPRSVMMNNSNNSNSNRPQRHLGPSKWSMAVGCSTNLVYPGSLEIDAMTKAVADQKKEQQKQQLLQQQQQKRQQQPSQQPNPFSGGNSNGSVVEGEVGGVDDDDHDDDDADSSSSSSSSSEAMPKPTHPVSVFVNTSYQPNPQTAVFGTANLNNDNVSHQYSLGSTHTFTDRTAARYSLTYLSRSPLPDDAPVLFGLKTYRHLAAAGSSGGIGIGGTASVGISASSGGQLLQWTAKWQNSYRSLLAVDLVHGVSVKANIGMLQGNSIDVGYSCDLPRSHDRRDPGDRRNPPPPTTGGGRRRGGTGRNLYDWLDRNVPLPKRIDASAVLGQFAKATAMVTHEITGLATAPTLSFGMEHDISLGRWAWIWELHYRQSTLRIPIPLLRLGSVVDHRRFYAERFWYGIYCLMVQSLIAELLNAETTTAAAARNDGGRRSPPPRGGGAVGGRDPAGPTRGRRRIRSTTGDPVLEAFPTGSAAGNVVVVVVKTKSEAERQLALMRPVADAKSDRASSGGLIVLKATYWQRFRVAADRTEKDDENGEEVHHHHEIVSMDATTQLRFWVRNGRLTIPGGFPKSSWMGFYSLHTESKLRRAAASPGSSRRWWSAGRRRLRDAFPGLAAAAAAMSGAKEDDNNNDEAAAAASPPASEEEENGFGLDPRLTVRYSHGGRVFEITVGDTESLALPSDRAEPLGDADTVR